MVSEFAEIPNISNNHIDIISLQDKTQNIIDFDNSPKTTFNGLVNANSLYFDDNINSISVSDFSQISQISDLLNKTQYITNEGSYTAIANDAVYYADALYHGVASYEGTINYSGTFTGFNNSSSGVAVSVGEFECLDGVTSSIQTQLDSKESSSSSINATRIADGSVTSIEFQYINTLSSNCKKTGGRRRRCFYVFLRP
jgi:hypothetical protein